MDGKYIIPTLEKINRMRQGEAIKCNLCDKGYIRPVGDKETAIVFECDNCGKSIRLD